MLTGCNCQGELENLLNGRQTRADPYQRWLVFGLKRPPFNTCRRAVWLCDLLSMHERTLSV